MASLIEIRRKASCPECDHFWAEHDLYGCQQYNCICKRIDREYRYENRAAVLDPID